METPTTEFVPVPDIGAFEGLLQESQQHPVVLFLHDPSCPISRAAHRQMTRLGGPVPLVDVRTGTQISRAIEERTGVQHESPQVILLDHGQAAWSASHYAITAQAVEVALRDTRKVSGAS